MNAGNAARSATTTVPAMTDLANCLAPGDVIKIVFANQAPENDALVRFIETIIRDGQLAFLGEPGYLDLFSAASTRRWCSSRTFRMDVTNTFDATNLTKRGVAPGLFESITLMPTY